MKLIIYIFLNYILSLPYIDYFEIQNSSLTNSEKNTTDDNSTFNRLFLENEAARKAIELEKSLMIVKSEEKTKELEKQTQEIKSNLKHSQLKFEAESDKRSLEAKNIKNKYQLENVQLMEETKRLEENIRSKQKEAYLISNQERKNLLLKETEVLKQQLEIKKNQLQLRLKLEFEAKEKASKERTLSGQQLLQSEIITSTQRSQLNQVSIQKELELLNKTNSVLDFQTKSSNNRVKLINDFIGNQLSQFDQQQELKSKQRIQRLMSQTSTENKVQEILNDQNKVKSERENYLIEKNKKREQYKLEKQNRKNLAKQLTLKKEMEKEEKEKKEIEDENKKLEIMKKKKALEDLEDEEFQQKLKRIRGEVDDSDEKLTNENDSEENNISKQPKQIEKEQEGDDDDDDDDS